MHRLEIKIPDSYNQRNLGWCTIPVERFREFEQTVEAWMIETFGNSRPCKPDNTRGRRIWSVKYNLTRHRVIVMCRYTDMIVMVRLRWC